MEGKHGCDVEGCNRPVRRVFHVGTEEAGLCAEHALKLYVKLQQRLQNYLLTTPPGADAPPGSRQPELSLLQYDKTHVTVDPESGNVRQYEQDKKLGRLHFKPGA